jgi:hypothetical protein
LLFVELVAETLGRLRAGDAGDLDFEVFLADFTTDVPSSLSDQPAKIRYPLHLGSAAK